MSSANVWQSLARKAINFSKSDSDSNETSNRSITSCCNSPPPLIQYPFTGEGVWVYQGDCAMMGNLA